MVKWAKFRFPPINLYIMPPTQEAFNIIMERLMKEGIKNMFQEDKAINWKELDEEVKSWESSTDNVISDMKKREAFGLQKYGKSLTVNTDEDMLQHLYEEILDASVYLKTLLNQRKKWG